MLTKKDKEYLKEEIKNAVVEALTVPIVLEKHRDDKTGQPLATPQIIQKEVFLPSYITEILPYHEGALRGMQENMDKEGQRLEKAIKAVELMSSILNGYQESILLTAEVSKNLKTITMEDSAGKREIRYIDNG